MPTINYSINDVRRLIAEKEGVKVNQVQVWWENYGMAELIDLDDVRAFEVKK